MLCRVMKDYNSTTCLSKNPVGVNLYNNSIKNYKSWLFSKFMEQTELHSSRHNAFTQQSLVEDGCLFVKSILLSGVIPLTFLLSLNQISLCLPKDKSESWPRWKARQAENHLFSLYRNTSVLGILILIQCWVAEINVISFKF